MTDGHSTSAALSVHAAVTYALSARAGNRDGGEKNDQNWLPRRIHGAFRQR